MLEYLTIIDRLLVKKRTIVRETSKYYKVYLPTEYSDIWDRLREDKRKVNIIVILPEVIEYVDKILFMNRAIIKEYDRYKLYLPRKYNNIWEKLWMENKKVDLVVVFH